MYYLFTDDNNSDWLVNLLKAYQGTGYYLLLFDMQEHMWEFGEILAVRENAARIFPELV